MADSELVIRSYRLCFELERRIHSIDRWRIPVPYGVPLRGVAYGVATLAAVLVAGRVPGSRRAARGAAPGASARDPPGRRRVRADPNAGRRPPRARRGAVVGSLAARRRRGSRRFGTADRLGPRVVADVAVAADDQAARYRRCLVRGPAEVTLRYPATGRLRRRTIEVRQSGDGPLWRGKRLSLHNGQRLRVR